MGKNTYKVYLTVAYTNILRVSRGGFPFFSTIRAEWSRVGAPVVEKARR